MGMQVRFLDSLGASVAASWHRLQMRLRSGAAMAAMYAYAAALIWPLAQELPYASGVALKKKKTKRSISVTVRLQVAVSLEIFIFLMIYLRPRKKPGKWCLPSFHCRKYFSLKSNHLILAPCEPAVINISTDFPDQGELGGHSPSFLFISFW